MHRHIILLIIYILVSTATFSQIIDSIESITIKAIRVNFQFNDSFYENTINFLPDEHFSIRKGFVKCPDEFRMTFKHKFGKSKQGKKYILKYELDTTNIDTLISYFPLLEYNPKKDSIDSDVYKKYGQLPMYPKVDSSYNLYYELKYSYLLRIMNEPMLNSPQINRALRLIYYEGPFPYIKAYHTIRVQWLNDSAYIYYTKVNLEDLKNQQITEKKNSYLKQKDVRRLEKYISRINFSDEGIDCLSQADRWLIEYKNDNDYYIFVRGEPNYALKHKESIVYFFGLTNMMSYLGRHYFQ